MKRFISIFAAFSLALSVAYANYPMVRNFSKMATKASTQNWDVVQHDNNWMYFANNQGLLEYDSDRWTVYPIGNYTNIRSLYYNEADDRIYAGASSEFGYYERNQQGVLSYKSLSDKLRPEQQNFSEVWNIHKIGEDLYFQSNKDIFIFAGDTLKQLSLPNRIDHSAVVYNMLLVSNMIDGVMMLVGDMFLPLPRAESILGKKICAILPFEESNMLFVTDLHGLYIFDGEKMEKYVTDIDRFICESQAFCADIKNSKLAIGTVRNGVVIKDLTTGANTYSNLHTGLQNNTVLSLTFDKQDNLWLGLDKGVGYVMINSPVYDLFGNNQQYGTGYASLIKNGLLYLGTNQGLYATEHPMKVSPIPLRPKSVSGISGQVWCLTDIDNTTFCGTDKGLFILNGHKAEKVNEVTGIWNLRKLNSRPDYILGASYKDFFLLKKVNNHWRYSHSIKGFNYTSGMFEEDSEGNIWFCHWIEGVFKLTLNETADSVSVERYDTTKGFYVTRNIQLIKFDDEIIFSSDGGFFRYDKNQNRIVHAKDIEDKLGIYPHSMNLVQMPDGNVWKVSPTTFGILFQTPEGNYTTDLTSFSILKNKLIYGFENFDPIDNDNVLISTEDGFSRANIAKAQENVAQPDIFSISIRSVYHTREQDSIMGGYSKYQQKTAQFSYQQNSIRFEYIAAEYRNTDAVTYSFMLEGYDSDWSAYAPANTKEYTRLPQGTYAFKVRAKSQLSAETAKISYQFTILPPWYASTAAWTVYFLLGLCLLFLLFWYVGKKSKEGAKEMEILKEKEMQEQEERFKADAKEREKEIIELKNKQLQYNLRHKSQELANSTMNLIRKNEILLELNNNIDKISTNLKSTVESQEIKKLLIKMQLDIKQNIERDDNWKKFAENFDLVYENYLKRLGDEYPVLTVSDKKLCAYLKMGLSSKDIAPLLNMSFRSVEMSRYRLRKKLNLDREVNLTEFLQNF